MLYQLSSAAAIAVGSRSVLVGPSMPLKLYSNYCDGVCTAVIRDCSLFTAKEEGEGGNRCLEWRRGKILKMRLEWGGNGLIMLKTSIAFFRKNLFSCCMAVVIYKVYKEI